METHFGQALLQSQIETQEETLSVLGKELHDNIGQLLNSTKLLIGVSQRQISNPPDTLIIADETLAKAINELRSLSKSLNKEWLEQFNFIENLETEIHRLNTAGALYFEFIHIDRLPLKSDEQLILFRIVQEAMQNAVKHAQAQHIQIAIAETQALLTVTVTDDGKGFTKETAKPDGLGMLNMKHRTHLLGGVITWQQAPEGGTVVAIQLPVKPMEL